MIHVRVIRRQTGGYILHRKAALFLEWGMLPYSIDPHFLRPSFDLLQLHVQNVGTCILKTFQQLQLTNNYFF